MRFKLLLLFSLISFYQFALGESKPSKENSDKPLLIANNHRNIRKTHTDINLFADNTNNSLPSITAINSLDSTQNKLLNLKRQKVLIDAENALLASEGTSPLNENLNLPTIDGVVIADNIKIAHIYFKNNAAMNATIGTRFGKYQITGISLFQVTLNYKKCDPLNPNKCSNSTINLPITYN